MAATAAMIARVRRMTGLVGTSAAEYSDADLTTIIETYPLLDELGSEPYTWDSSTEPPTQEANDDWIPTYDLNAAAAAIWQERAASLADNFDFSADGGSYQRSQAYEQYMKQARFYMARRSARAVATIKWPPENTNAQVPNWVGNAPEVD